MKSKFIRTGLFLIIQVSIIFTLISQPAIHSSTDIHHPLIAHQGMVSSQHPEATKVGLEILQQGGNAIDAAVAVGFSLSVVLPRAGNLGGGGFMLVHINKENDTYAYNYREMAPKKAFKDMFLDQDGNVDRRKEAFSYQSSGVPGTVAGLLHTLEEHGTMTPRQVIAPAIKLAKEGFPLTHDLARLLVSYKDRLKANPETEAIFYPDDKEFYEPGDLLIQADLAWTLEQIASQGSDGFYKGEVASRIAADMKANQGFITKEDMAKYRVEKMKPVQGTYRGYEIISMPPPSSGGLHLIQMLNILEQFPITTMGHNSSSTIHIMTEAMKYAYADRSKHLGDPNFWDVPVDWITSKDYAKGLAEEIGYAAKPSKVIAPGNPMDHESEETTHFTVIDDEGNIVSNTYTLNFSFGSGIVARGTGVLMNNEMGDFAAKPGTPDAFGLIGGEANSIEPGKRPLSSMTPTIVLKDGEPYFATGSPGGSRIITTVLQIVMNIIDHEMNVAEATHAPRIHHQWYPETLFLEEVGISYDTQHLLRSKGHLVQVRNAMGSTQTIMIQDGNLLGSADPRRPDARVMGY